MANLKSDLSALKQQCRCQLKKIRQAVDPKRRKQASVQACLQLSNWTQSTGLILSFANFGSEINLWPLNQKLASEGRLVLPRLENEQLCLFRVTHISHLERGASGLLEPSISHCLPIDFSLIEIALIPGLGFDLKTKNRLGYGKGNFDRLLASAFSAQTWGVGFLEQAIENLPHDSQDIPLKQIYLY